MHGATESSMEIVVRQNGGLGNQLFQYAAGSYYAQRYGATMRMVHDPAKRAFSLGHPRPFLLSRFSIQSPVSESRPWERIALSTQWQLAPLRELVQPYMLRRLKTDRKIIADLPDKTELLAYCSLSKKQAALYEGAVAELRNMWLGSTSSTLGPVRSK